MSMGLGVVSESLAVRATRGMQCLLVRPRIGCHYRFVGILLAAWFACLGFVSGVNPVWQWQQAAECHQLMFGSAAQAQLSTPAAGVHLAGHAAQTRNVTGCMRTPFFVKCFTGD